MEEKIFKADYKGKQVDTKIQQSAYLLGQPVFDRTDIGIEDIPIRENLKQAFKVLSQGDGEPFFFISEMKLGEEFPTTYDDIMTKEWAESFVKKLDTAPFPMSALGHTNVSKPMERVESHGYVLGGKVQGDSMFLRNYLLPGKTDTTKEFAKKTIAEMKAGLLSTSISNFQRYVRIEDDAGEMKWYVVESINGQRNDIVEHDLTGSDAAIVAQSYKAERQQSATNPNIGESMNKEEMLKKLQTLKGNGELSKAEIAETFGLELMTDEAKSAQQSLKTITDELGDGDPVVAIKSLKDKASRTDESEFKVHKSEALKEVFKDNLASLLEDATELFALKSGSKEDCVSEAKRLSELKILKEKASMLASNMNGHRDHSQITGTQTSNSDVIEM